MSLIAFFTQPEAAVVSVVGGKGSNLMALTQGAFPVPPGFVVTAAAYQLFLDRIDCLDRELSQFDYDRPDQLRQQCIALRERLARHDLTPEVAEAIRAGLDKLGAETVAVRSSSTFED